MTYKVICKSCKADRKIGIVVNQDREIIDWFDNLPDPQEVKIISGRKRLDGEWGWSCICGNDDIMSEQEKKTVRNHQTPDPQDITTLVSNLKVQKPKFEMEKV